VWQVRQCGGGGGVVVRWCGVCAEVWCRQWQVCVCVCVCVGAGGVVVVCGVQCGVWCGVVWWQWCEWWVVWCV